MLHRRPDEGDSGCWCPRGNVQATEKTQNFRNIGAKNTQDYDIMRGELSAFWSLRPRKLHSCFYWKMMVMGHHRKYYLFSFLHIHDPGARALCLVTPQINSWMMTFECRGQANNPSHLYTLLSSRPSAYVWSDSLLVRTQCHFFAEHFRKQSKHLACLLTACVLRKEVLMLL